MIPDWVRQYVGRRYEAGAAGPARYDCYRLMAAVMRDRFGVDAPLCTATVAGASPQEQAAVLSAGIGEWMPVEAPRAGDGVLLRVGREACHCGVMVTSAHVLHICESIDARVERLDLLRGFRPAGFYRWSA